MRLFVALVPPAAARAALAGWARSALLAGPGLRLLDPAAIHVTLAFLGGRDPGAVDKIAAVALGAAEGLPAPELTPSGALALPHHRPRAIAVELADHDGRARAVRSAVVDALVDAGMHEPERRAPLDHATVARVRRGERAPAPTSAPPADPFVATEVALYRSDTGPSGSRYTRLAAVELSVRES